ncbi:hypothetical protein AB4Z52_32620 [Rhizobium sp. 2YAF20]|uniref:hypothetical protein n=1 Tax=Rhizobium sp. 2YAF20 TaxID=3233027 RepID=UPI003F9DD534
MVVFKYSAENVERAAEIEKQLKNLALEMASSNIKQIKYEELLALQQGLIAERDALRIKD